MEIKAEFLSIVAESIRNRSLDRCSRWAAVRRIMPGGESYSLSDYPYMAGILDSRAKRNWIMKGTQVGASEGGFTISFYEMDYHQKDVIYYFPTGKVAERFSKTRFSQAIQLSPYLRDAVHNDAVEIKQIGTTTLHILGANSIANLKSTSCGRLFLDEVDDWTPRQIYLAEQRVSGQKDSDWIIWGASTPKYPSCGIHKQYLKSTRERWRFNCPHCKEKIQLDWDASFVVCGEHEDDENVEKSYIKCSKCEHKLDHETKKDWLSPMNGGEWVATNPKADPKLSRGFHISQLYSPTVTPGEIAIQFLRGEGDEDARRTFHNDVLGLPYIEEAHQINDTQLDAAMRKYTLADPETLPTAHPEGLYTLGIDQGEPNYWAAIRWQFVRDRLGDPNDRAIGRVVGLGRILQDNWDEIHQLMYDYQASKCVVDYGPDPTKPRVFARAFPDCVYLCQYIVGKSGRELTIIEDDYGANLVKCDKTSWLSKSLGRVMSGNLELPLDMPLEFRQHLMSPVRTLTKIGDDLAAKYIKSGPDHWAHAINYAEIALKILDPGLHASSIITEKR